MSTLANGGHFLFTFERAAFRFNALNVLVASIRRTACFITGILVYHSHCMNSCFTASLLPSRPAVPLQPLEYHLQWWQESQQVFFFLFFFFVFRKFPICLKQNLQEEDNLSTRDKGLVPQRVLCSEVLLYSVCRNV